MSLYMENYGELISSTEYIYSVESKLIEFMRHCDKNNSFNVIIDKENNCYRMSTYVPNRNKYGVLYDKKELKRFMIMKDLFNKPLEFFTKTISAPKIKVDKKIDVEMGSYKFEIKPETESCIVQDSEDGTIYIYGVQGTTCEPDYTNLKEIHYILLDPQMIYSQHRYMYTQDYLYIPDKLSATYDDFDLTDKFGIIFLKYKPCIFNSDNKYRLKYDKYGILSFMGRDKTVARYESATCKTSDGEKDAYVVSIHPLLYDPFDIKNTYKGLVEEGYYVLEYLDLHDDKAVTYYRNIYKCDRYKELMKEITNPKYDNELIIDDKRPSYLVSIPAEILFKDII